MKAITGRGGARSYESTNESQADLLTLAIFLACAMNISPSASSESTVVRSYVVFWDEFRDLPAPRGLCCRCFLFVDSRKTSANFQATSSSTKNPTGFLHRRLDERPDFDGVGSLRSTQAAVGTRVGIGGGTETRTDRDGGAAGAAGASVAVPDTDDSLCNPKFTRYEHHWYIR
jgi:hypothetical protein